MKFCFICFSFIFLALITGCHTPKKSVGYPLENGRYKNISTGKSPVFVMFEDSLIKLFSLSKKKNSFFADKKSETTFLFSETQSNPPKALKLLIPSFDIDIITIPLNTDFQQRGFLNSSILISAGPSIVGQGKIFIHSNTNKTPLGEDRRMISHCGYGAGLFAGVGSTAMNPWVTFNQIDKKLWIYQGKPWFGLTIGLNLN